MKKISHFTLPEHTNSLYKNEAISSISLTKNIAGKINELVDAYNNLSSDDLKWKQEQEGRIRKGVIYMKDNLLNSIHDLFNTLNDSGEFKDILSDVVLGDLKADIEATNLFYEGITTEKEYDAASKTYYYITKIPRTDRNGNIIPLKMGLANDDKSCTTLENTLNFAWRKNATLATNCGVFDVENERPIASVIYEGRILHEAVPTITPEKYQYFAITRDNQYKVYPIGTNPARMISDGVYYACCIFNSLIINGLPVLQTDLRKEPRQSVGFTQNKDIIFISCDGRSLESAGMTYDDLARVHAMNGSINAYILDGGGSTATVLRGIKQNENVDNHTTDRSVSTFLYVVKPTSENASVENNSGNDLGRVKQFLYGQLKGRTDFVRGYIRLLGQENFLSPGIELYVNGEAARRSKWGLSYDKNNERNSYLYFSLKAGEAEKTNLLRVYDQGVWLQTYHGPSSSRPAAPGIGMQYFDEGLNKPIWYNGSQWVDATGTPV